MLTTPKGLRLHIGIFGRRNAGKSSILNAFLGQQVSIVSEVPGTTTDPVEKVMELKPIGPVVFIDTAGLDDRGALGQKRVAGTRKVIERTELAILVADGWTAYEDNLLKLFQERNIPCVVAANKADLRDNHGVEEQASRSGAQWVVRLSATDNTGFAKLREAVIQAAPREFIEQPSPMAGLIMPHDQVVLVVPIDIEAPKGRLIVPQVQVLRDILDHDARAVVVKETLLAETLAGLKTKPALVITDSQAFKQVAEIVPAAIPLTSFSIIFARFKGDLEQLAQGARSIAGLAEGDRILIAEACSHHPVQDDIGRVKLPRWLRARTGRRLAIKVVGGHDYPDDLSPYKLIIHCGGCVFNRRELLTRIERARQARVPITNYGLAIAFLHGILERALRPMRL